MKKFIKKHFLVSLILVLLAILIVSVVIAFEVNEKSLNNNLNYYKDLCQNEEYSNSNSELCTSTDELPNSIEYDFFTSMSDILVFDLYFLNFFAFLIVLIPTFGFISKILNSNQVSYWTTRKSYFSFIIYFLKQAYRYVWILPIIGVFLITIILHTSNTQIDFQTIEDTSIWTNETMKNIPLFVVLYITNLLLHSVLFVNIALIVLRFQKNSIKGLILSFIVYLSCEIVLETIFNLLILKIIFNNNIGNIFNIINLFIFNDSYGLMVPIYFITCILLFSFLIVFLVYRNKEKLIIYCES